MTYPIGFWNYPDIETMTPADVKLWADCGITLNMSPSYDNESPESCDLLRAMLDECLKYDMKLILRDPRTLWTDAASDPEDYRARFREALADFGAHPAVYGFFIGDEPSGQKAFEDCKAALRIQREEAPSLVPFLNFLPYWPGIEQEHLGGRSFDEWAQNFIAESGSPLICYDCYAQLNPEESGTHNYFENLRRFSALARESGAQIWTTLLSVGHFRYRVPSEDDLRWQVMTAAAAGCRGILWFTFYSNGGYRNYRGEPVNEYREKTPAYYALSHVLRRFRDEYGSLLMSLKYKSAYHVGKCYGGYSPFEDNVSHPLIRRVFSDHGVPAMVSFFEDENGREYTLLVNNSPFESDLFKLAVDPGARVCNIRENGASVKDMALFHHDAFWRKGDRENQAGVWLAPGQMEIFVIEK